MTHNRLGPGFLTFDVRDLANLSHSEHPKPYYVTVRTDPAQVIQDLVRNCFTIDGVQTYAKFAQEVVDDQGIRYISEPWTAELWLETQVRAPCHTCCLRGRAPASGDACQCPSWHTSIRICSARCLVQLPCQ